MVYCHECGSEITEVETFCPFCGISLQPVELADDEDSNADAETNLTADQLTDDAEDDLDMSETIVANSGSWVEEKQPAIESSYIDISTLKAEDEENSDVEEADVEASSESFSDESDDVQTDLEASSDISDKQEDVEELLSDDSAEVSLTPENQDETPLTPDFLEDNTLVSSSLDINKIEQAKADEIIIETIKEDTSANTSEEISDEVDSINESSNEVSASSKVVEDEIVKHTTPTEIQSANDEEIDDAVSVIDSKADVWKTDDEYTSTDLLKEELQIESSKISKTFEPNLENADESSVSEFKTDDVADTSSDEIVAETPIQIDLTDIQLQNSEMNLDVKENEEIQSAETEFETPETIEEEAFSQTEDSSEEAVIDEDIQAESKSSEDFAEMESEEPAIDEAEETKSETTPNIGMGDTDGSKAPKLKPLDEGTVLNGRYEIVRKIGGGGMGAVYLANDRNLGGVLRAVKEMVQSYIEETQQDKAVNDFKRESMLLTSLDHPSIPTIYDYFFDEKEGRFYLVMKYISGGDLSARLRAAPEGRLDEISVTEWALQITEVLDYLHSKNPPIVYRDLKPANIMIDGNTNRVMLIDFGIARWINKEEKGVTAVGTMGYAPPELFSGNVEPSSDIYSLGSTMFHLLTGADPQSNPLLIFDFQKHPRPRQINSQLSDQMERILMRAVEYSADRRFSSAAEMRNSLKEHLENLKLGRVSYGIKETPMSIPLSDQPVFCGFCGQKIVATDMFCAFCGAKQPMAQPGVHSEEYNLGTVTAKLIIEGTSELDYPSFELVKNDNLVGRRDPMSNIFPEVDLSKFDPQTKISRKHARIHREGDKYILEDLGSSNGTILISSLKEKMRVEPHQRQVLANGDKIVLGDTTLQFIVG